MNEPEMYSRKEASQLDIADVVKQARVCGDYDAATMMLQQYEICGEEAARVMDIASKCLSLVYARNAFKGNRAKILEAVDRILIPRETEGAVQIPINGEFSYKADKPKETKGVRIPIKGESQPCNVPCKVERPYDKPITARMPDGRVGAIA